MTQQNETEDNKRKITRPQRFTAVIAWLTFLLLFGLLLAGTVIGVVKLAAMLYRFFAG